MPRRTIPLPALLILAAMLSLSSCGDGNDGTLKAPPRPDTAVTDADAAGLEELTPDEQDAEAGPPRIPPPNGSAAGSPPLDRTGGALRVPSPEPRDPREEAEILQAFEDLRTACLAKDFSRLWRLASGSTRTLVKRFRDQMRRHDSTSARGRAELRKLREPFGLSDDSALQMEPEFFFGALGRSAAEHRGEEWEAQAKALRALVVDRVEYIWTLLGRTAVVVCSLEGKTALRVEFVRSWPNYDSWEFLQAIRPGSSPRLSRWRRLERKVSAYLPTRQEHIRNVGLVVEVGRDGVDDESMKRIHSLLEDLERSCRESGGDLPEVLLDASPELPFEDVIQLIDALMLARVLEISFTHTRGGEPPGGIHVNGVSLWEVISLSDLPSTKDHPALERVIGLPGLREDGGEGR